MIAARAGGGRDLHAVRLRRAGRRRPVRRHRHGGRARPAPHDRRAAASAALFGAALLLLSAAGGLVAAERPEAAAILLIRLGRGRRSRVAPGRRRDHHPHPGGRARPAPRRRCCFPLRVGCPHRSSAPRSRRAAPWRPSPAACWAVRRSRWRWWRCKPSRPGWRGPRSRRWRRSRCWGSRPRSRSRCARRRARASPRPRARARRGRWRACWPRRSGSPSRCSGHARSG